MALIRNLPKADLENVLEGLRALAFDRYYVETNYWTQLLTEAQAALNELEKDDVCEVCKEGDDLYEDVVANFVDIDAKPRLAHEDCGNTMGWSLA